MSRISCTLGIAHVEPALTEERALLLQELVAREAAEGGRLGGGEGHRVIVEEELVTRDVSGGHNHPPHPGPGLHQPGVAGGTILVITLIFGRQVHQTDSHLSFVDLLVSSTETD